MFDFCPQILLIEDDPVFRRLMVAYLELWGAKVLEADSGEDGLQQAFRQKPDLVLSDLLLPAPAGHEVIACLKQRYPELPVIAISGQQKMADVSRALRAGAEDYLIKPIRNWTMVAEVIGASLRPDPQRLLAELNEHLAFYRKEDIAASRLMQSWRQQPECELGPWRLSCRQSSPWVLTEYLHLNQDLLLLLAEFDPLNMDTPVVMSLVAFLLNEPLRHYRGDQDNMLDSPARTLEYINRLILDVGLDTRVNLALFRLDARARVVEVANGGMAGSDWLEHCDAGPLGVEELSVSQLRYPFSFPLELSLKGGFGSEIQFTAHHGDH